MKNLFKGLLVVSFIVVAGFLFMLKTADVQATECQEHYQCEYYENCISGKCVMVAIPSPSPTPTPTESCSKTTFEICMEKAKKSGFKCKVIKGEGNEKWYSICFIKRF